MNTSNTNNNIDQTETVADQHKTLTPADKFLAIAKALEPTDRKSIVYEKLKENREAINIMVNKKIPSKEIIKYFNECFDGTFQYKITLKDLQGILPSRKKAKPKADF